MLPCPTLSVLLLTTIPATFSYQCSLSYEGECYDCPYNKGICHESVPRTVYIGGIIYTVDPNDPNWDKNPKTAMVVDYNKIIYVGDDAGANKLATENSYSREVNLDGRTVLPGLHDVHNHIMEAYNKISSTCMLPMDTKPDTPEMKAPFTSRNCQDNQIATDWVLGWGHSLHSMLEYIAENKGDPKTILDEIVLDSQGGVMPAIMMEQTSHSVWVNSEALRLAGLDKNSVVGKEEHGSLYMKNETTGELNGILFENAGLEIIRLAMDPVKYPEVVKEAYKGLLKNGLYLQAKLGITSSVDARVYWMENFDQVWERTRDQKKLTNRVTQSLWAYPELDDDFQIAELKKRFEDNSEDELLRTNQIKLYMDGILESRTASLTFDYKDYFPDLGIGNRGMNYFDKPRLVKYLKKLQSFRPDGRGFDFLIHSIGDQATRDALDAIEETKESGINARHKLTHVEVVAEEDLPRFKELGVLADPQVAGSWTLNKEWDLSYVAQFIGRSKAKLNIPLTKFLEKGATMTLSSDHDVGELNPFIGMRNAVTRKYQNISLKDAVTAYTYNAAYSMRQEKLGSLVKDNQADFIVLDKDIFNIDINDLSKVKVKLTVVNGKEVWIK